MHIIVKQFTVILCIHCYTMWKKTTMNHSLVMVLPGDICVSEFSRLLYGIQKTYCTDYRYLHVTGSLPHTLHLT
jgi:hypothetical protein